MFKEKNVPSDSNAELRPDLVENRSAEEEQKRKELVGLLRNVRLSGVRREKAIQNQQEKEESIENTLSEADINEIADLVINNKKTDEIILESDMELIIEALWDNEQSKENKLVSFIYQGDTQEEKEKRIVAVEKIISLQEKPLSFPLLAALSESRRYLEVSLLTKKLAKNLEKTEDSFSDELKNKIEALVRVNTPEGNLLMHKIIDFLSADIATLEGLTYMNLGRDESCRLYDRFAIRFSKEFVKKIAPICENYLIKKHLNNAGERGVFLEDIAKHGSLIIGPGVDDAHIYAYRHMQESYDFRLQYGINKGTLIKEMVIPIAPGYLGKYKGEKLDFILKASNATKRSIDEKQFIAQNDSSNDHIYDDLRESIELSKGSHNPGKQWLDIFFFEQKLKETGQKFFFDTSRIDLEALQSSTKNDILQNNEEYIKSIEGEKDQVKSLTREEYLQRLFPAGGASEDVTYNYEYLMRLNMRKVIEDDFGIEISALPLSSQVQFLKYINGRTVDEVKEMQDALSNCKDYKIDVAKAFLACTEDEKTYSQAIIKLAEKLDPDIAKQLFGKYAEIASAVDGVREYLNETFQSEKKPDEKLVNQAAQNLLHRGNELLKSFADKVDANADISSLLEKLDTVKAEAMLFTSTFKALHQNQDFRILDLRELALAQFDVLDAPDLKKQKATIDEMHHIYRENYRDRTSFSQEFSDALIKIFDDSLENQNTRFYLLKHQGVVAAFCRFDYKYRDDGTLDSIYAGSFNASQAYWQGKVGETMVEQALLEQQAFGVPIIADCSPMAPIAKKYINELGFIAVKESEFKGVSGFSIEILPDAEKLFSSKGLNIEELVRDIKLKKDLGENITAMTCPAGIRPDFSLLQEGYALTRYFENDGQTYCVFEKMKPTKKTSKTIREVA